MSKSITIAAIVAVALTAPGSAQEASPAERVAELLGVAATGRLSEQEHAELVQGLRDLIASADVQTPKALGLTQGAHALLRPQDKADLRPRWLARLAGTQQAAADLSVDLARDATVLFDQLAGPAEKSKMVVSWMAACDRWKTADAQTLLRFLWALNAGKGEQVDNLKAAWAGHVWATYLRSEAGGAIGADPGKLTAPEYVELAIQTHGLLSPQQKAELAKTLVPRTTTPAAAAELSMEDIRKARQLLGSLRRPLDVAEIMAVWIARSEKWKQAGRADLGYLCDHLRPRAGAGAPKAGVARLMDHARSQKLFSDTEQIVRGDLNGWVVMVRAMRYFMGTSDRLAAAGRLKALLVQDKGATRQLSTRQLAELAGTLREFGLRAEAGEVLVTWLGANDCSNLSASQLAEVAECFEHARSAQAGREKPGVGDLIWRDYLSKDEFLNSLSLADLAGFVTNVRSVLTAAQKAGVADELTDRFAEARVLPNLKVADVIALTRALGATDAPAEAADVVLGWIEASEAWAEAGIYDKQLLAAVLKAGETDASRQKAADWAMKVYEQTLATLKPDPQERISALVSLSRFLNQMGLLGKGTGYPEFANALAAGVKAGASAGSKRDCYYLALPLGTDETQQILLDQLADDHGRVRRDLAKVVAHAHRDYDSIDNWTALIDRRLADEAVTGDRRATWLLARADAGSLAGASWARRKTWLDQALAAAGSQALTLVIAGDVCHAYEETGEHDEALAFLGSIEAKIPTAEGAEVIEAMREQVRESRTEEINLRAARLRKAAEKLEALAWEAGANGNERLRRFYLVNAGRVRQRLAEVLGAAGD